MLDNNNKYYEVKEINLPDTITSIGIGQFAGFNVTSVVIPDSVTSIGASAFEYCDMLESATVPFIGNTLEGETNTYFQYVFGREQNSLKELTITNAKKIAAYSLSGCGIEKIIVTNPDVIIGDYAFDSCYSLQSITLPYTRYELEDGNYAYLSSILGSTQVSVNLKEVIITHATTIPTGAFFNLEHIETIILPEGVTSIGETAFYGCTSLKSINLPDTITSIGSRAFADCSSLETIKLPSKLTKISISLFIWCSSLKSIIIPDKVSVIESSAFDGCNALKSIVLPTSVTTIEHFAFARCSSLEQIYYKGSEEQWSMITIGEYNDGLSSGKYIYNYVA